MLKWIKFIEKYYIFIRNNWYSYIAEIKFYEK